MKNNAVLPALIFVTLSLVTRNSPAAEISWSEPFELTSETDINLSFGPVVYAQNGGDNIGNEAFIPDETLATLSPVKVVTIAGQQIDFEGIDAIYGDEASFGQLGFPFDTFGDAVDHLAGDDTNVTFEVRNSRSTDIPQVVFDPTPATLFDPPEPRDYSVPTGNAGLDSILNSMVFMDSRNSLGSGQTELSAGALGISLNDLEVGTEYQVQVIGGADDRRFASDPLIVDPEYMATTTGNGVSPIGTLIDEAGNFVENIGGFLDLDEDGVGHVTSALGTFTADAESQFFELLLSRGRNVGLSAIILSQAGEDALDCNGDGQVDTGDFTCATGQTIDATLARAGFLAGDFDLDRSVAFADFLILSANFAKQNATYVEGDADKNGVVEFADFLSLSANFGRTAPATASVPEPNALTCLFCGLAVCVFRNRRRLADVC